MSNMRITQAYDELRAAYAARSKCVGLPEVQRTAELAQIIYDQITELTRMLRADHAAHNCRHTPKLIAQLTETPVNPDLQP